MKKLAILGASYLQKPLVEKAISMGLETHCFAWDNDEAVCKECAHFFYPISVLEKELILQKCQEIQVNGITTIATDICVPTISYVAERMNLTANSFHSSLLSTNKGLMRNAFVQHHVNSPQSVVVGSYEECSVFDFNFPLIIKPTDRSGSRGVTQLENSSNLKNALERGLEESLEKKVVVEEFVEGDEVSVESISWNGQHYILAITDKVTTQAPFFVELQHHQPSSLHHSIQEKIKSETLKALDSLEIKYGASHSEFKITPNGEVFAIEVGARMGGDFIGSHLVLLSTSYDFLKGVIEVALGSFTVPVFGQQNYSGVYYLCKETESLLPYFNFDNPFDSEKKILNYNLKNITNSNDRSGFLIYRSNQKIELI